MVGESFPRDQKLTHSVAEHVRDRLLKRLLAGPRPLTSVLGLVADHVVTPV